MGLYKISVNQNDGSTYSLENMKGRVLLIVNTALHCGFSSQYKGLQFLEDKYKDQGFAVLDFPSNQFANQTPEDNEEINAVCNDRYQTTFFRGAKIDVNGHDEALLYSFLKYHKGGLFNRNIKWNFTKFLIDRRGRVIKRYSPFVKPSRIGKDIEQLLKEEVK